RKVSSPVAFIVLSGKVNRSHTKNQIEPTQAGKLKARVGRVRPDELRLPYFLMQSVPNLPNFTIAEELSVNSMVSDIKEHRLGLSLV
ncbi:MAG: hypothetical protein AAB891_01250, partial [Patescibacteria group bacterium]